MPPPLFAFGWCSIIGGIDRNMCVTDAIYIHCIQCFQSVHCLLELCTIWDANTYIQKPNSYQNSYEATIHYKITVTLIGFHQCIVLLLRFDLQVQIQCQTCLDSIYLHKNC